MKTASILLLVLAASIMASAQSLTSALAGTSLASIQNNPDGSPEYMQVPLTFGSLLLHNDFPCGAKLCFTTGPLLERHGNRMTFDLGGIFKLEGNTTDGRSYSYTASFIQAKLSPIGEDRYEFTGEVMGDLIFDGAMYSGLHAVISETSEVFKGKIVNGIAISGGGVSIAF